MEGRRLILNDGTVLEGWNAGYNSGSLWCYGGGISMAEAAGLFLDPEKTAVITFQYGEMEETYEDCTVCRSLAQDTDGKISVGMMKAVGGNV